MITKYTAFRCPIDSLDKARAKAARDRRSLSNYLVGLVERDVRNEPNPIKLHRVKKSAKTS